MVVANRDRVGGAMDALKAGLAPFVSREFIAHYRGRSAQVLQSVHRMRVRDHRRPFDEMDAAALLRVMWDSWNEVFRDTLGQMERSLVSELRDVRNRWAHQGSFSTDDAYRALDSTHRLLSAVSAPEAAVVEKMKNELLRQKFEEQARSQRRRAPTEQADAPSASSLTAWREVVSPHPDVASGKYQQAEFAADLWQVHIGEGSDEYRDPTEFFRRTYLTESLSGLLTNGIRRLSGGGEGEPVVQLQTNFGGGKTHSMLALYHMFSGVSAASLPGVGDLAESSKMSEMPRVNRVALVGNRISPGSPSVKADGAEVRTLWGELAWQLGFAAGGLAEAGKAYDRVRADDERATNPGDTLRQLLASYGPALILIDEWVAYARQLHDEGDLPAGSFETQFTFAQALTESAKLVDNCLIVISLPSSGGADAAYGGQADDVEVGGLRGRTALSRLRNVVGRVESSWRPASADESFEIVRRRLFQPISDQSGFVKRDNVARAYHDLYRGEAQEFPPETREPDYEKRIREAYPIHPEVFERLYSDWSTLPSFQRTRGVLRLMAAVIHTLWESGDRGSLILPSSIPIDDNEVQFELTRYLPENWNPVIERDVDGPGSRPMRIDGGAANLGRHSACRRVARTIFLGSAPTPTAANLGLDDRRIKLGCVAPSEPTAVFGDAMRRLAESATYLYRDGARYWFSTQPTVANLAESRAEELRRDPERVAGEIERRIKGELRAKGDFLRVHPFPASGQDVQDSMDAGLVALGVIYPHSRGDESKALTAAKAILSSRGSAPRLFQNSLVFLAADEARLQDLDEAMRRRLAWQSILDDRETLDLPPHQVRQAETQLESADGAVTGRIGETYQWLLAPKQASPVSSVEWDAIRLTARDALAKRVSERMKSDEALLTGFAGTRLRMEMDRVPLWGGDHVAIRKLSEYFASYPYLPRLQGANVLLDAIRQGVSLLTWEEDTFAYADSYDEEAKCYRGLLTAKHVSLSEDDTGLIVKPEAARRQIDDEMPDGDKRCSPAPPEPDDSDNGRPPSPPAPAPLAKRYHGSVRLDPKRVGANASQIAEEVIAHLSALVDAKVRLTLEIEADMPGGASALVVRIVTENSNQLKFDYSGFERE